MISILRSARSFLENLKCTLDVDDFQRVTIDIARAVGKFSTSDLGLWSALQEVGPSECHLAIVHAEYGRKN